MIDGNNTSFEWQAHSCDVCVLPVGSFEQHGEHLPLCTDIVAAEYFARIACAGLGAALLPTLPLGTCMEHSGFRGSVSLRPETLMQIVRDIAGEMEKQNFKIMLIVNGHGGNFALGPVVRDINRCDRALKILLVNWYDFRDPSLFPKPKDHGLDFHAGEMETSLMLALRPDLVGKHHTDAPSQKDQEFPLIQSDLNTFGVGHFAPGGAVGYPSLATKEKGEAVIAGVRERMIPYLRERIERLQKQPRYSGRGGIAFRILREDDLDVAMQLKAQAGWNQTQNDWRFLLHNYSQQCFAAVHNGQTVGTATAINYGDSLAWIGMVLVDDNFRRMGIASRLVERALESTRACRVVGLDATATGKQVYDRLGFVDDYSLSRVIHPCVPPIDIGEGVIPLQEKHWAEVIAFDKRVFGADRSALLRMLYDNVPESAWCMELNGKLRGFCLARNGANFHHIGPVISEDIETAKALLQRALSAQRGQVVGLDVLDSQDELEQWLNDLGFARRRTFTRMVFGEKSMPGINAKQFVIAGPEFG